MTVRDDVRQYIWNLLDQIVPGKYCRVCYLGNLMSSRGNPPILIEVTPGDLDKRSKNDSTKSVLNYVPKCSAV